MWGTGVSAQLPPKSRSLLGWRGQRRCGDGVCKGTQKCLTRALHTALRAPGVGHHRERPSVVLGCWGLRAAPRHSPTQARTAPAPGGLQRHTSSLLSRERHWGPFPRAGGSVPAAGAGHGTGMLPAQGSTGPALRPARGLLPVPVSWGCSRGHAALTGWQELGRAAGRQWGHREVLRKHLGCRYPLL